jgi:hypothetical protein
MRYRYVICTLTTLLIGLVIAFPTGARAQPTPANEDYRPYVVEIYSQSKELIGAGTSISFSGLILTAKHILEAAPEGGERSPNYRLNVLFRAHKNQEFREAELLVAHPFMDLAILIDRLGAPMQPMKIGKSNELKRGERIIVIGHEQTRPPRTPELYKVREGTVDEVNREGHIIVARGVEQGTSGGPAIYNGRLIGVVRSSSIDRAKIVPIDDARDYLRLRGVPISEDGSAEVSDDIAKLAGKISQYERIIMDIQTDVGWTAEVTATWKRQDRTGFPEDFILRIWYDKKLASQPTFDARVSVTATPMFAGKAFKGLRNNKIKSFPRADWLLANKGRIEFKNFGSDLKALLQRHYRRHGIKPDDFRGFDIVAGIASISGEGFVRAPKDHKV